MAIVNNSKELTRGDTGLFSVSLYDSQGTEYIPDSGETLTFYLLKKDCDDLTEAIFVKDIPISTMELELTAEDTRNLSVGLYAYRIRLHDAADHEYTVVKSKLKIIC